MTYRILVTGSRKWTDFDLVEDRLTEEFFHGEAVSLRHEIVVVHGNAVGVDAMAQLIAVKHGIRTEPHPARGFPSPLDRNQYMVDLGADVCLAFALDWASGTGHCARAARKAGIPTLDLGVSTR